MLLSLPSSRVTPSASWVLRIFVLKLNIKNAQNWGVHSNACSVLQRLLWYSEENKEWNVSRSTTESVSGFLHFPVKKWPVSSLLSGMGSLLSALTPMYWVRCPEGKMGTSSFKVLPTRCPLAWQALKLGSKSLLYALLLPSTSITRKPQFWHCHLWPIDPQGS